MAERNPSVEATSPLTVVDSLQQRRHDFDNALTASFGGKHGALINHVIVLADYLWELECQTDGLPLGAALLFDRQCQWLTNNAFVTALLTSLWCRRQDWHPRPAKSLICAALTQDIGLGQLAQQGYSQKTLSPHGQQRWRQHPTQSLKYLHRLGVRNRLWLQTVAEHQELLDGSGYPHGKTAALLPQASRVVALAGRLAELLLPRQWRKATGIAQTLRYLADRPRHYDAKLLEQFAALLLPYLPGSLVQLDDGQRVIVQQGMNGEGMLAIQALPQGKLPSPLPPARQVSLNQLQFQFAPQPWGHTTLANQLWADEPPEPTDPPDEQPPAPGPALITLLKHLQQDHPGKGDLDQSLAEHPALGDLLTGHLRQRFPTRQIRDARHALLMVGPQQCVPLLLQLALQQQLEKHNFPALAPLRHKVHAATSLAALLATETSELLPTQAAMFTLLNLAPLYLDHGLQNTLPPRQPSLEQLSLATAMSLMGCHQAPEHLKQVAQLARDWQQPRAAQQAIALLASDAPATNKHSPMARQLAAACQAAVLLTHHCCHGLPLNTPQLASRVLPALKQLGLGKSQLQEILQQFAETHPFCEL